MSDSQNSSTGMQEIQNSVHMDSEKTSIKRSTRISSNEQSTAEENGNDSVLGQPNFKRMKPNEVVEGANITLRGPKLFPPESANIALQLSAGCRIGPNFDETKIRRLPPYEPLPYPEQYTRIVQDLIRCALRPEEVIAALKVSAPGEPFTVVTFPDKVTGKFECRYIPVVQDVNSAQAWFAEWLESLGCCKHLFLPNFLADKFICRQCFELNQGQRRGVAASGNEAASERQATQIKRENYEEEQRKVAEEERQKAAEELKKAEDEDRKKLEEEEAQKKKHEAEQNAIRDEKEDETVEKEKQSFKNERRLYDEILDSHLSRDKTRAQHAAERYSTINSVFLILFKIPEERTELRPDLKNTITSGAPGVSFTHDVKVNSYNFDGKVMWQLGNEWAMDYSVLKKITTHSCDGYFSSLNANGTMLDMWHSLLLHCPKCVTAASLAKGLNRLRRFMLESEMPRKEREEVEKMEKRRQEEEEKRMAEEQRVRMEEEERQKKETEQNAVKAQEEREKEKKEIYKEEKLYDKIKNMWPSGDITTAENATECYNILNSVFLILFKIPEERTELRPDLKNTITSGSPDVSFTHDVRVNIYGIWNGLGNEMWKLGDQKAIESCVLKKITSHSCPGHFTPLNLNGTMLDRWHSLLLHCPKCTDASSLSVCLDKLINFMRDERMIKKARERKEEERREQNEVERRKRREHKRKRREKGRAMKRENYNNVMAFFFYHFNLPEKRTVLRPDLGIPVVSNSLDLLLFKDKVRPHTFRDGAKEMWQLGYEEPMDSSILKAITTHRCPARRPYINTEGTLLEMWHSLLLRCPKCIREYSAEGALYKVREFIRAERLRS